MGTVYWLLSLGQVMNNLRFIFTALFVGASLGCIFVPPPPPPPPATTTYSPPLTNCKCGQANTVSKIVGGVATEANEYPWQVGLISSQSSSRPFCGGSLISDREILTAAHCTQSPISWVTLAEHDITKADGEIKAQVCSTINHPNYNGNTLENDFAILRLCNPVSFTKMLSPACLPSSSSNNYDSVTATVSGWGTLSQGGSQPSVLQEVNVNTMTNAQCTSAPMKYSSSSIRSNMLCAGGQGGKDSCQGDSGGPLVTKESSGSYSLIGVVSWGIGCAQEGYPGVYSRVTSQLGWIQSNMQGSTCPAT